VTVPVVVALAGRSLGRPERQACMSMGTVVMMLMRPQAVLVFQCAVHRTTVRLRRPHRLPSRACCRAGR